ncbi:hypothetical protein AWM75_04435 [Aerococcus urinaehominis]|uniref:Uncharacterized protein n=1 Tax=Aerococcus urinaehominis TaxID=128944 RepID=A0A120IAV6_9LACT|nr:hypothetical protein [Aerococcus urinaehominis]AMB99294.1 hypothetical protein AWM75_04435 [Aerococcus urinaehominis]SDM19267.1 hypothetical protein SAMN04487985_10815 [Aerococcus urinaehominis]
MTKENAAIIMALACVAINIYIVWKGQTAEGMTARQQARLKTVSGVCLLLAFIAMTFGSQLGLK